MSGIEKFMFYWIPIILGILFLGAMLLIHHEVHKAREYAREEARIFDERVQTATEEEWTCYLEGNEIDIKTVNLYQYQVAFDIDNKIVKLSPRLVRRNTTVSPVFMIRP